jgi:hypothetical protein
LPKHPEAREKAMSWYAAHVIMAVRLIGQRQTRYPVWENIVLIEAGSEAEAFAKAEHIGRGEEGDDGGTFRWGGQPATWVFRGIRKLTECVSAADRPGDGTEVSYVEMELDSQEAVDLLAAGEPVAVSYNERYRPLKKAVAAKEKNARRKRA